MTIKEMIEKKKELGYSNETLSKLSGVPFSTIQKIFSGTTDRPRQKTIEAIQKVLESGEASAMIYNTAYARTSGTAEAVAAYCTKRKGEYTLEDYYAIPDERRVELIDGEIFNMAAPSALHQLILGELYAQFRTSVDAHGLPCRVILSPCDVQLDLDDRTMVQPDLFVLCRDIDLKNRSIPGAPDLTVEILSDSTRAKDLLLKTYKYKNAGVREYWIVDPVKQEVLVYDFSDESLTPVKYTFTDRIPIGISGGKCMIDFERIKNALA